MRFYVTLQGKKSLIAWEHLNRLSPTLIIQSVKIIYEIHNNSPRRQGIRNLLGTRYSTKRRPCVIMEITGFGNTEFHLQEMHKSPRGGCLRLINVDNKWLEI